MRRDDAQKAPNARATDLYFSLGGCKLVFRLCIVSAPGHHYTKGARRRCFLVARNFSALVLKCLRAAAI